MMAKKKRETKKAIIMMTIEIKITPSSSLSIEAIQRYKTHSAYPSFQWISKVVLTFAAKTKAFSKQTCPRIGLVYYQQ